MSLSRKIFLRAPNRAINRALNLLETRPVRKSQLPFFLIIGAPRSGSTLLYQVLTNALEVGYVSNAHARFYGGISYYEKWIQPLKNRKPHDFDSRHGLTKGATAPHECGAYWYQFFRRKPQFVTEADVQPRSMEKLNHSLTRIAQSFHRPFIFKNLHCVLRLGPLVKHFPNLKFVVIRRNLQTNALSILNSRKTVFGDLHEWWSVEPENIDDLKKLPPEAQVVEQIQEIHSEVDRHRKLKQNESRFIDINYEELCCDPHSVVEKVAFFIEQDGGQVGRTDFATPTQFPNKEICQPKDELSKRVLNYIDST